MIPNLNDIISHIDNLTCYPAHYRKYNRNIMKNFYSLYSIASKSKAKGYDPSDFIETEIAFDLADRVERMFSLPLSTRLRELLTQYRTEYSALKLAEEVSLGKFGYFDTEESLNIGIRIGLAVVTDGITVAPLQGISSVNIKQNEDGSNYIAINFAGPIRSAGGTEAAFTLIIADHLRKVLGLESYKINGWNDDEIGRFVEELRIYEREIGNFQFRVSDKDIEFTLSHLPVEVDGVETDPIEVIVHRNLRRINTDRIRGGALRVVNDGIIGRARKLSSVVNNLSLTGWEWLNNLEGGLQHNSDEINEKNSHFQDVISGRPVLSMPEKTGGFRLRYGRSYNTGLSAVGINPIIPIILDYPIVLGTQVKLNLPGKAGIITFVDSIEPPIVCLKDGSVTKIQSIKHAKSLVTKIDKVIHLGDILISYGDFLENTTKLKPSGYVEEWWSHDLLVAIKEKYGTIIRCSENIGFNTKKLSNLCEKPLVIYPSLKEALLISNKLGIPLHPRYLYYWNNISASEIILLKNRIQIINPNINDCLITLLATNQFEKILKKIGVPFIKENELLKITGDDAYVIITTLGLTKLEKSIPEWKNIEDLLTKLSNIIIRTKTSTYVGLRVGRPEKAMIRKMKPPVHVLFPISNYGGSRRDIIKASKNDHIEIELVNMICSECGSVSTRKRCTTCGGNSIIKKLCPSCRRIIEGDICQTCRLNTISYASVLFPIKQALSSAIKKVGYIPTPPLKGVKGLTNNMRIPEILEKGLLRRRFNLFVYKDGTIRFDTTNAPLTHFRPRDINTSVNNLLKLGYSFDINNIPLRNDDQIVELFVQDIIIPYDAASCLFNISLFLDELLQKIYQLKPYYKLKSREDILGHLIVGLAPHTSVGILGRVIGFTQSQVCYAHPYWHSAKRRDCDGDEDAIILLLDILINFSKEYLPSQIGGLMDAPLLIQPIIIPKEVQRQAHNIDIIDKYPLDFYNSTLSELLPNDLTNIMDIVRNRLNNEQQFFNFHFTHDTNVLTIERERSTYSTLKTIQEKLNKQIELAKTIDAVNPDEVVSSVLNTHLLPDIIGNMKAYATQSFRCKTCNRSFRRIPIKSVCLYCGGELQSTVTRNSVEKYLHIALKLSEEFNVSDYLSNRLKIISNEFSLLFPKKDKEQLELSQFIKN